MNIFQKRGIVICGLSGAIAVALGALGAHWLKGRLSTGLITTDLLAAFETGVRFQVFHTLAMLGVVALLFGGDHRLLRISFWLFFFGILLFSGSLYLLSTRHLMEMEWLKAMGPVTPLGGLSLIAGWLVLAAYGFKKG